MNEGWRSIAASAALVGAATALLAAPLPEATAAVARVALAALDTPLVQQGHWLHHAGGFVAEVGWDCTAFWPALVLVLAMALFGRARGLALRQLAPGLLAAVVFIILINQLRLIAVVWVGVHAPGAFAWVHEAASPLLLVGAGAAFLMLALGRGGQAPGARRLAAG